MKKKLYCFDFDGTLTTSDTLLEFIKYAKGRGRFLMVFLMYSPLLVLMKLHLYPNWKAKQQIFAHLFAGMRIEKFDALCRGFAEENQHLLRPKGITLVHEALVAGAQVFIVSASIDNWVRPFFDIRNLKGVQVLGTQIEVEDGKLTGRYVGDIVDGRRKAELLRLIAQVENVDIRQTVAVGDGANDLPMISIAGLGIAFHAKPKVKATANQSISTIGLDGILYFLGYKDSYLES